MMRISFLSIFIGSFSLALVNAIMHGYEQAIYEKMQGIHAQVTVRGYGEQMDSDALYAFTQKRFPEIIGFSPISINHALIHSNHKDATPSVVMLKGIDPFKERIISTIEQKIIPTHHSAPLLLPACVSDDTVLIGSTLAQHLGVCQGDSIQITYTESMETSHRKVTMESISVAIGGIFKTGIDEFDTGLVLCTHTLLRKLFSSAPITHINLKLSPGTDEKATIERLKKEVGLEIYSWKDLYPALVAALKLEKYAMFLILTLIVVVASMNIISLLFMHITHKRSDIAILSALGACQSTIRAIFMYIGMLLALVGSVSGISCAWLATYILNNYPWIELPDAYYVTHLPALMDWEIICSVFFISMIISFLAVWGTTKQTQKIALSDVLRFEG